MTAFFAIVKLTLRNALRSHIFQLLLVLLLLCAVGLPMTVSGSGEGAWAYIRIALKYSLGTVSFILALSTVWISSLVMTQDMEKYQLHMVVVKPVSRLKLYLAKYTGVVLLHAVLLLLAGLMIYTVVMVRFSRNDFAEEDKTRITNEVLVGRRVFLPNPPDMNRLVKESIEQQLEDIQKSMGRNLRADASEMEAEIRNSVSEQLLQERSEVAFQKYGEWVFENLPKDNQLPIFLRYRLYLGKMESEEQRLSDGMWAGYYVTKAKPDDAGNDANGAPQEASEEDYSRMWIALSDMPEQNYTGDFHERPIPNEMIDPDGRISLRYINLDPKKEKVLFQSVDGPQLLIKVTGFTENFFRGLLVILMMLLVYTGISCTAAAAFSMPTAIFTVLSYMFVGSVVPLIMNTSMLWDASKYTGYWVGRFIMMFVAPLQEFEVAPKIANGELVEFAFLGNLTWQYFLLRALPFILVGMWLYWRRELGLVIRK